MNIKIIETHQEVLFTYNGIDYKYRWLSNGSQGFGYIEKGGVTIYGPYNHQCTDEGRKVYDAYINHRRGQ